MKLVIGYGNTLRQDDGVGWLIADQLTPLYHPSHVTIIRTHQLMPEHALSIAQAERVVFIDASLQGTYGDITLSPINPASILADPHALHPPDVLHLAQSLYGASPNACLLTITGMNFGLGEDISQPVLDAIPHALKIIHQCLTDHLDRPKAQCHPKK